MPKYLVLLALSFICLAITCDAQSSKPKNYRQVDPTTEDEINHVIPQGNGNGHTASTKPTPTDDSADDVDTPSDDDSSTADDDPPPAPAPRNRSTQRMPSPTNACRTMRGACQVGFGMPGTPCTCSGTFVQMTPWGPRAIPFTDLGVLQ
jgi:hypothetical protein